MTASEHKGEGMYSLLNRIFGDCEKEVSWTNQPLTNKAQTMKNIEESDEYLVFLRDLMKSKCTKDLPCTKWNRGEFKASGFVRADLTSKHLCYTKQFGSILDVFKKPEILFSFKH